MPWVSLHIYLEYEFDQMKPQFSFLLCMFIIISSYGYFYGGEHDYISCASRKQALKGNTFSPTSEALVIPHFAVVGNRHLSPSACSQFSCSQFQFSEINSGPKECVFWLCEEGKFLISSTVAVYGNKEHFCCAKQLLFLKMHFLSILTKLTAKPQTQNFNSDDSFLST